MGELEGGQGFFYFSLGAWIKEGRADLANFPIDTT
jgi:hypothetical protein